MIGLEAKIMGRTQVRAALHAFPKTMHDQFLRFLYGVRASYIGTRSGKRGKFRRDLAKLKRGDGAPPEFARPGR